MLNLMEAIWSKIKTHVETVIEIPVVDGPRVGEQTHLLAEPQRWEGYCDEQ